MEDAEIEQGSEWFLVLTPGLTRPEHLSARCRSLPVLSAKKLETEHISDTRQFWYLSLLIKVASSGFKPTMY